jgi:hypothetical protein
MINTTTTLSEIICIKNKTSQHVPCSLKTHGSHATRSHFVASTILAPSLLEPISRAPLQTLESDMCHVCPKTRNPMQFVSTCTPPLETSCTLCVGKIPHRMWQLQSN